MIHPLHKALARAQILDIAVNTRQVSSSARELSVVSSSRRGQAGSSGPRRDTERATSLPNN